MTGGKEKCIDCIVKLGEFIDELAGLRVHRPSEFIDNLPKCREKLESLYRAGCIESYHWERLKNELALLPEIIRRDIRATEDRLGFLLKGLEDLFRDVIGVCRENSP
jgi:hypothetical protein